MAEKQSKLASQVKANTSRLDEMERRLGGASGSGGSESGSHHHESSGRCFCSQPEVAERTFDASVSVERAQLIRLIAKKWVNGTVLHYAFFQGSPLGTDEAEMQIVRGAFDVWADQDIGLVFREVDAIDDAEIRIGFKRGDGAWSYLGRDILDLAPGERTMNFGWDLTSGPGEIDTAVHEIGHTLGFPHEHQNPNAGIVWDEDAVYADLAGWPNFWPRAKTFHNIIRKIPPDTVEGTAWDPDSIMHYPFGAGLIEEPAQYRTGLNPAPGLSGKDISQVKLFYPALEQAMPELRRMELQRISIGPGDQVNFSVIPQWNRYYNFRTFGDADTVMVLFEDDNGTPRYVKGDDDSGTGFNAKFRVRLNKNRKYILRVRLYYRMTSADTAVMMW